MVQCITKLNNNTSKTNLINATIKYSNKTKLNMEIMEHNYNFLEIQYGTKSLPQREVLASGI